ncbi:SUKH-4 family immunity protein [Kitasatospora viridis]|uniref:Nucleic acid/nucleotide deaminase of polymorphic system toxin n=1 Tax=Kitasatospora viridis TaxID=281105 RepID=A0A561UFU2_9ACTN|nr:SUKH-4 family immunity protein [Kitasatospora viridis]TWF98232.1 nucleic acid/nucleotide deaminase of polymorphic system toxin [Kitasatospora viridis]
MVTYAQAQDLAAEWINGGVPPFQQREVRVREFDLGFVCWAEDRAGGPSSDGGAAKLVIARESGASTLWPALPVNEVVRRYQEAYGKPVGGASNGLNKPLPGPVEATSFLLSPPQWMQEAGEAAIAAEAAKLGNAAPVPAPAPAAEAPVPFADTASQFADAAARREAAPADAGQPAPPAPPAPYAPAPDAPVPHGLPLTGPARLSTPPVSDRPAGDGPTMLAPPPSWEGDEHGEEVPAPVTPPDARTVRMPPPTAARPPADPYNPYPSAEAAAPAQPVPAQPAPAPAQPAPVGGYAPTVLATDGPPGLMGLPGAPGQPTPPGPPAVEQAPTMLAGEPPVAPTPPGPPAVEYAPTMLATDGPPGLMGLPGAPGQPTPPGPPSRGRSDQSAPPPPPPAALRGTGGGGPASSGRGRSDTSAPPPPPPSGLLGAKASTPAPVPQASAPQAQQPPAGAADLSDAATSKSSMPARPAQGGVPGAAAPVPGLPPQGAPVPPGVPTVGPGYLAVLSYRAPDGSEQKVMFRSEPGTPHPEWRILQELRRLNVPAEQVLELHTELEACDLPGGYCRRLITSSWPNVRITNTAAYGRDLASRQSGMAHLLNHLDELHQLAGGPRRPRPVRAPLPAPGTVAQLPPVPPQQLAAELGQYFGPAVFRYEQRAVSRQGVPEIVAQTLVWAGLPTNFGPFFWAHAPENRPIPTLAELAAERGRQAAPDAGGYLVLGNDYGRQLCVQYGTAAVVAVDLEGTGEPPRFVNTGVPEFVRSLALLGRMWPLRYGLTPDQAGRWTTDFQAELAAVDPAALQAPDTWWAVLLEQFWDGLL